MIVAGRLVLADGVRPGQVEISGGEITRVGDGLGRPDLSFGDDHLVFPGFGDVHVHLRQGQEHKEDFGTGCAAALNGGVCFMLDMPNNPTPPVDAATLQAKRQAAGDPPVDLDFYAAVGPGTRPIPGHPHYKAYVGPSVGHLFFRNRQALEETLAAYAGQRVTFHCEDPEIMAAHAGEATHEAQRPPEAEIEAIRTVLEISARVGLRPHVAHLSTAAGLHLVREAGATCEIAPHHLFFDLDNRAAFDRSRFLKMNPPLRPAADRVVLLQAFLDGGIDLLATDHAPHTVAEKETENPSGVPLLDTYGGFVAWLLQRGMPPERAARHCCELPGRFFATRRVGRLAEGYRGHLAVLKPDDPWTVRAEDLRTKCGWSPFEGVTLPGRVALTVCGGRVFRAGREVT